MGRVLRVAAAICAVLLFAATSRSDVVDDIEPDMTSAIPEATLEAPVQPAPGSETELKDPFAPYGIGPIEEAVPLEELSIEEQEVALDGRDPAGWDGVHSAFGRAVAESGKRATARASEHVLGVDDLDTTGVVP